MRAAQFFCSILTNQSLRLCCCCVRAVVADKARSVLSLSVYLKQSLSPFSYINVDISSLRNWMKCQGGKGEGQ